MPTRNAELQFRQALIVRLSASDFAREISRRGWRDSDAMTAQSLGVSAQTLAAAVRIAQLQWAIPESIRQDLFLPVALRPGLDKAAKRANLSLGHLARALCHAVLQTTCEPSSRRRLWVEPPRQPDGKRTRRGYSHISTRFNEALATALDLRSAALGLSRHNYVVRWMADLSEGKLRTLPVAIVPVTVEQLYADARAYVLPYILDEQADRSGSDVGLGADGRGSAGPGGELAGQSLAGGGLAGADAADADARHRG